jgi:hypothetical protein
MNDAGQQQQFPKDSCPHCGDQTGTCIALRCLKCEQLLCSRMVTPVLPTSPYYPYKHRVHDHTCGPVQPLLLPGGGP